MQFSSLSSCYTEVNKISETSEEFAFACPSINLLFCIIRTIIAPVACDGGCNVVKKPDQTNLPYLILLHPSDLHNIASCDT